MTRELVGYAPVDSGQLCIVDPCYIKEWGDYEDESSTYRQACNVTLGDKGAGPFLDNEYASGLAVVSRTAYGDGRYPCYVERDRQGRIIRFSVDFADEGEANPC